MAKKKKARSHGHYCKICGEYKANEKFSGKGHTTHICKACSRLSAAEKAEAMTINRLYDLPLRRLTDSEKKWLENRVHDKRPEVASLAKEIYNTRFPHAARNAQKKQLTIDTLVFEIHAEVYDEYGDFEIVNRRFTANRHSRILTMNDFDRPDIDCTLTLDEEQISNLLLWTVNTLEVFMWAEDYELSDDGAGGDYELAEDDADSEADFDPFLDIDIDFDFGNDNGNDLNNTYSSLVQKLKVSVTSVAESLYIWHKNIFFLLWIDAAQNRFTDRSSEAELEQDENGDIPYWRVQIKYSNGTVQDTANYDYDYLDDRPKDLYDALWEYFTPDELDDLATEKDF